MRRERTMSRESVEAGRFRNSAPAPRLPGPATEGGACDVPPCF